MRIELRSRTRSHLGAIISHCIWYLYVFRTEAAADDVDADLGGVFDGRYVGDTYGERLRIIKEDWAVVQRASKQHEKGQEEEEAVEEAKGKEEGEEQGEGGFGQQGMAMAILRQVLRCFHVFLQRTEPKGPYDVSGLRTAVT